MLNIEVSTDSIRIGERFAVAFQRTLRIPDDGRTYPLPPGLGRFPLYRVADFAERLPPEWGERGGVFIPMYQREALWLAFSAAPWKPNAVQIAVGRINAISGEHDQARLHADPQNYVVCPEQPWLDGIHTGQGAIRQFVAMPLGLGYTIEASLTGTEQFGGIQITVFEPKPGKFPDEPPVKLAAGPERLAGWRPGAAQAMGLGAGGLMRQKVYPDPYGVGTWDPEDYGRIFVHILNSAQFREVTGVEAPPTPIDATTYTTHGLPWFDLYDEAKADIPPSERLAQARTVAERDAERGQPTGADESFEVLPGQIRKLDRDASGAMPSESTPPDAERNTPTGG
ncbi:MAG TPA: hypothetical protein VLK82_17595 [Candidatus Tectomicrobia bacterium]|nr:hypothetical protein [Candidatus Tectomicrobia bacterium]